MSGFCERGDRGTVAQRHDVARCIQPGQGDVLPPHDAHLPLQYYLSQVGQGQLQLQGSPQELALGAGEQGDSPAGTHRF